MSNEEKLPPEFLNLKVIGEGGNSKVYAGTEKSTKKNVVVKMKLPSRKKNSLYGLKEFDIGNTFDCDFIAKYLSYNANNSYIYTVMEHEQGSMTVYKNEIKIPYLEKISLLKKILVGLHSCHNNGILHLDMKFENILLRSRKRQGVFVDEPLITDFGFSVHVRSVRSGTFIRSKFGTTGYFAPEQHSGYHENHLDRYIYRGSLDIWAFGIIAFRLILEDRIYKNNPNDQELIYKDMERYFKDSNVTNLINRRNNDIFKSLLNEDKKDVLELLEGTLKWNADERLTTGQLISLPIFRKTVKINMVCPLNLNRHFYINVKSKSLPFCLNICNEVALRFHDANLIIYYHMVDLIYRACSISPYSLYKENYAEVICLTCIVIAADYHGYKNTILDDISDRANLMVRQLKYTIYRPYLFEAAANIDEVHHHIKHIIPNPIEYFKSYDIVEPNKNNIMEYDSRELAYAKIGDIL